MFLSLFLAAATAISPAVSDGAGLLDMAVKALPGLFVALIMFLINYVRDNSKQYENRIKQLEISNTNHENRMTQFQLEREALVDKTNQRFASVEGKLNNVDKLSVEVNKLTQDLSVVNEKISQTSKTIEKLDTKFDKILEELRKRN